MRYEKLRINYSDTDCLDFDEKEQIGSVSVWTDMEMIRLLDDIRKKQNNTDLASDLDNDVYYNFYIVFNLRLKTIGVQGVCRNGEKDDEQWYNLPMKSEEKTNVLYQVIDCLVNYVYDVI